LVELYRQWIKKQAIPKETEQREKIAKQLILQIEIAASRIESGIKLLTDPKVFTAFTIANRFMDRSPRVMSGQGRFSNCELRARPALPARSVNNAAWAPLDDW
jgi:hypothetical protein